MVTNLWGLIDNFKQRKRSSGKLEYLLLTVDSHGKSLLNIAFCAPPLSIHFLFNRFKVAGRIPLDAKPVAVFSANHSDGSIFCKQSAVFSVLIDSVILFELRLQRLRQFSLPSKGSTKELDNSRFTCASASDDSVEPWVEPNSEDLGATHVARLRNLNRIQHQRCVFVWVIRILVGPTYGKLSVQQG